MSDLDKLIERGFSFEQINQILKVREYGYDLSKYITPEIEVETIRVLKDMLEKNKTY